MGFEGANVLFDTWVHPLMMGLEEHLITMFRGDFEFHEDAAPSHLGRSATPAALPPSAPIAVPADPDAHVRVHPLLAWTELDIWRYIAREGIPVVDLYFSRNGKRYRSLGDQDITFPVESEAATVEEILDELRATRTSERAGRAMDHESEDAFERLRVAGYL